MSKLSKKAKERLKDWKDNYVEKIERPSWDETWMNYAEEISRRSHDAQTKLGCVLVNTDNILISEGYNGFPRGIDDKNLPNLRPAKYTFFSALHAEINAIYNAARIGRSTMDSVAYITGEPCFNCYIGLWQAGIKSIVYKKKKIVMFETDENYEINMEIIKHLTKHKLSMREYVC